MNFILIIYTFQVDIFWIPSFSAEFLKNLQKIPENLAKFPNDFSESLN
jgi:hypothetical protein